MLRIVRLVDGLVRRRPHRLAGAAKVQGLSFERALRASVRLLLVWCVLCALAIGLGRQALTLALPLYDGVIEVIQDDFVATVQMTHTPDGWVLRMQPFLVRPLRLNADLSMPAGTRLRWFVTHVDHTLVPPVLLLMVTLALPAARWRELAVRLLLALPVLILVLALTAPVLLAGQVAIMAADLARLAGAPQRQTPLVALMIFMESGGRWLLPLAGGVLCIALARRLTGEAGEKKTPGNARR